MTAVTDDELTMIRSTAASIAGRCGGTDDHVVCWTALREAGLTELRLADDGGEPLGTSAMATAVVEELAGVICGAPLVGHLLATELIRLVGAATPDGVLSVLLDARWQGLASDDGQAVDAVLAEHAVGVDAEGTVVVRPLGAVVKGIDPTRPTRLAVGASQPLGTISAADRAAFDAFARTLLAADLLGAAASVFGSAVAYAKDRVQFGVPIGSFQAVQHLCAQAHVHLEAIRSTLLYATRALDTDDVPAQARTAIIAKAYAGDAAVEVVQTAVQVFGGIAITVEHPAHRHLRRVLVDRDVFGDADHLTDLLLEEIDA